MDLQLLAERGIDNQSSNSLRKGIRSYRKVIAEHESKIRDPYSFYPDWDKLSEREQQGCIRHWRKEIKTASESIRAREEELTKRGDSYE